MDVRNKLDTISYMLQNEYLDKYVDLIQSNLNKEGIPGKTQKHHIIPASYYKLKNMSVNNSDQNLVNLIYKDHILAHYYLALCTQGDLKRAMTNAFLMLSNFNFELDCQQLDHYQELYESWYSTQKGKIPSNKGVPMKQEQKDKISKTLMGHSVSEESRIRMRNAQLNMSPEKRQNIIIANKNKNYRPTEETRAKQSEALKGHEVSLEARVKIVSANSQKLRGGRWFNDGIKNIYVRPGESVNQGWIPGKIKTCKRWYNNGLCELQSEICPEGYILGRLPHKLRMKNK